MQTVTIITVVILAICFFLLGRDLTCWYFKINDKIKLQNEQIKLQKENFQMLRMIHQELTKTKP